uniref:F-box domain-containing protein n=2 Tax=Oryza glaberrima TaxID=4538 RepID=I1R3M3_ORYGL
MPTWPVHSILHADVVFLYLSGPNTGNNTGETERYMVSINVQHREAISISKLSPDDSSPPPRYFPSSFNSYINKLSAREKGGDNVTVRTNEKAEYISGLSEDCLALAISLTTPMDACRCCAVSRAFQKAANSDSVWRHFLPKDYLSILARADDRVHFTSEKKLLVSLVKDHVLLDQHSKSLWLERTSLAKCYLLSSRSLAIAWEDHPLKWRWISLPDSRFEEVAELLKVCWLDLCGRVNCRELSPNTEYAAYLVFKLTDDSYGLDCQTQEADITMDDQVVSAKRTISFYPRPRPSTRETLSNMCRIEEAGQAEEPSYPRERGDGWLEVQLGHFYNDLEDTGVVVIRLKEHIQLNWKRGLILEGMEIRRNI